MIFLLVMVYFALSAALVAWGLRQKQRYFQFPTVIGAAWVFVLGPQVLNAVLRPEKYPAGALRDHGLEIALLMCILCMVAGWTGYRIRRGTCAAPPGQWSQEKIFLSGVLLYLVGMMFALQMIRYVGGLREYFLAGGYYLDQWGGALVKYKFFSRLVYVGLSFILAATILQPTITRIVLIAVGLLYPLCVIIFLGDRSDTAAIVFALATPLFFVKRWVPPRSVVLVAMLLGGLACHIWPAYRELTSTGRFDEIRDLDARALLLNRIYGTQYSEFDVMVVTGAAINREFNLWLGAGIYNSLIYNFVPGQFVGRRAKDSFMVTSPLPGRTTDQLYGWAVQKGSTWTGPASLFSEFWFFGCLLYGVIGYLYRWLWDAANRAQNYGMQILYGMVVWVIPYLVVVSFHTFLTTVITVLAFVCPVLYLIREPGISGNHLLRRSGIYVCRG